MARGCRYAFCLRLHHITETAVLRHSNLVLVSRDNLELLGLNVGYFGLGDARTEHREIGERAFIRSRGRFCCSIFGSAWRSVRYTQLHTLRVPAKISPLVVYTQWWNENSIFPEVNKLIGVRQSCETRILFSGQGHVITAV